MGAVEEASAAEIEAVYRTNVFGLLNVSRAVLPHMRRARSGRILNISSIGGYRGAAGFGVYSSTKFAVEGLSEAMHAELAPLGIHVTVIEPGYFRTDFLDAASLSVSPHELPTMKRLQRKSAPSRGVSTTISQEIPPSSRTYLLPLRMRQTRRSASRSAATPSRPSRPSTKRIRTSFRNGATSRYLRISSNDP
jgi:NAD(P)-dependent dehydrogenase (short-subunit alcohol dehydrogenase family)